MIAQARLQSAIDDVAPGINCVFPSPSSAVLQFASEHTEQQRTAAQAALAAFDWSQAAHDAWLRSKQRSEAVAALNASREEAIMAARAVTLAAIDEINALRAWLVSFKAEVTASATLAALKTRVAALPNMPPRTNQQLRTVITAAINNGSADA